MANNPKVFGNLPPKAPISVGSTLVAPKQPAAPTRAEQPLPVDIFPKDAPTEPTVEKLWGGGEHRKAAMKAIKSSAELGKLLKAFPEDETLINETIRSFALDNRSA